MKHRTLRDRARQRLPLPLAILVAGLLALWGGSTARLHAQGGGLIAFTSNRTGFDDIFLMPAGGGDAVNLTNSQANDGSPTWSPDGQRLAFTSDRDGDAGDIWLMNIDGSDPVNLTQNAAMDISPAWSPDGRWIAFVSDRDGNEEIYLKDATGQAPSTPINLTHYSGNDGDPAWSPDGGRMVFRSFRHGNWELYMMDLPDPLDAGPTPVTRLTDSDGSEGNPAWSPEGSRIAYNRMDDLNEDIYIIDVPEEAGTVVPVPRQLTDHPDSDYGPTWSPDGTQIVFFSYRDGDFDLYRLDVPASPDIPVGEPVALTVNDRTGDTSPAWQPDPATAPPLTALTAPAEPVPATALITFDGEAVDWDHTILCSWGTLDGGLTWAFSLCPGAAHPDGQPITPDEVMIAVWEALADDPALSAVLSVEGILPPEGNRLRFALDRADESFPLLLDGLTVSAGG